MLIECRPSINQDVDRVPIKMSFEGVSQGYQSTVDQRMKFVHMIRTPRTWSNKGQGKTRDFVSFIYLFVIVVVVWTSGANSPPPLDQPLICF